MEDGPAIPEPPDVPHDVEARVLAAVEKLERFLARAESGAIDGAGARDDDPRPELSVVIPVYNEEATLPELADALLPELRALGSYEVVFVDDGSRDRSRELVLKLRADDPAVKLIGLSRNFGHQSALSAGLEHASGRAVIFMDADLQDPPDVIPQLVERWQEGFDVVYAVRQARGEGPLKRLSAFLFYRLLQASADIHIPLDAGDFCLVDERVASELRALPERRRFLRGLRSWVGFRQTGVPYHRPPRVAGETKYTTRKMLRLALDGLLSFSSAPLRMATYLGFLVAAAGMVYLAVAVYTRLFIGHIPSGWTSTIAIMLLLGGAQLVLVGVLGQYVARIYDETKSRPVYVVNEAHGFD